MILVDENGRAFKQPSRIPPYAPEYFCDLPVINNPREFRGRFRSLIPKMIHSFIKISHSDSGEDEYSLGLNKRGGDVYFFGLFGAPPAPYFDSPPRLFFK